MSPTGLRLCGNGTLIPAVTGAALCVDSRDQLGPKILFALPSLTRGVPFGALRTGATGTLIVSAARLIASQR